jgi:predicted transcriptional regulator
MPVHEKTAQSVEDNILDELRREGGALSPSQLVMSTQIPYDIVNSVVERLAEQGKVKIAKDGVPVVHLSK